MTPRQLERPRASRLEHEHLVESADDRLTCRARRAPEARP